MKRETSNVKGEREKRLLLFDVSPFTKFTVNRLKKNFAKKLDNQQIDFDFGESNVKINY